MGATAEISPFTHANHRLIPHRLVQNDQLKTLSSNLVKSFKSDGLKQLNSMRFKKFTLSSNHNKYIYLDLLWKYKQLILRDSSLDWSDASCISEI